jgi:hypothetical protein
MEGDSWPVGCAPSWRRGCGGDNGSPGTRRCWTVMAIWPKVEPWKNWLERENRRRGTLVFSCALWHIQRKKLQPNPIYIIKALQLGDQPG